LTQQASHKEGLSALQVVFFLTEQMGNFKRIKELFKSKAKIDKK